MVLDRSIRWLGRLPAVLAALLMLALGAWPGAAASERGPRRAVLAAAPAALEDPNLARVIVKVRSGGALARAADASGRAQHAARLGVRLALPLVDGRPLGAHTQGLRGRGLSSRQLVARLMAQPDVEWAVVDERRYITAVPNDPYYGPNQASITPAVGQWYLRKPEGAVLSAIDAEAAWDLSTGSASVTVAVLDTGVRFDHPDLAGKLWPGYDFVSRDANARDGDGRDADPSDPGDWSVASDTCGAIDSSWHGTQVAGLIGANTGNGIGMASVGRQVMVLPVRVLGKCGGFDSDILAAMLWAAGISFPVGDRILPNLGTEPPANLHPAQVINLSLGSVGSCSEAYLDILARLAEKNVTVVVAAGNTTGLAVNSPANCSGVIAVAGLRHAGTKVGYSSLGPQVALAAPAGNCINETGVCLYPLLTTDNSGATTPGANIYSDSFKASLGTSFASPLVAGTVGLMLSLDPTLTPAQVKSLLQASSRPFPTTGAQTDGAVACHAPTSTQQVECYCTAETASTPSTCGAGMLDAGAALAAVSANLAPTSVFSASNLSPTVGASVTLDGSAAAPPNGRTLVRYRWVLTVGAGLASLSGPTDAADARSITLLTTGVGTVVVSLTVTDSAGVSRSSSQTLTVVAPPVVVPPAPAASGGGALGGQWLLGLGAAVWALRRRRPAA